MVYHQCIDVDVSPDTCSQEGTTKSLHISRASSHEHMPTLATGPSSEPSTPTTSAPPAELPDETTAACGVLSYVHVKDSLVALNTAVSVRAIGV